MNQITVDGFASSLQDLAGIESQNLSLIEKKFAVQMQSEGNGLRLSGEEASLDKTKRVLRLLDQSLNRYHHIDKQALNYLIDLVEKNKDERFLELMDDVIAKTHVGKQIRPKTLGQKVFIDQIRKHDLTFAIGPAGTGKTFLAVCYAVDMLKKNKIKKIILTRPAVEAGENLGFLPGDLKEKVDPYLRPLYDALDEMLSAERTERYVDKGIIEIAPLAYMRGRTLDDAVVILDEAQNTSKAQMLMFLSRLGQNSKMIVTGDIQQIDLPKGEESGLSVARRYLQHIQDIAFVELTEVDVVRHPLVVKIIQEFEKGEALDASNPHRR